MSYSIIIPVYNEEESLPTLFSEIKKVIIRDLKSFELIFIDDGSTDKSLKVIEEIKNRAELPVKIISLRSNQGKSAALMAGFRQASGDFIITMDADLQDDPKEIWPLIDKLNEGYDLVSGYKKNRHDPINKTIPSRIFNYLVRKTTGVSLHDINCGLKIYRQEVTRSLILYGELYRFIPVLAASAGFNITEIQVNHRPRKYGKSKFGASRFVRGLLDLLTVIVQTKFIRRPLHFFGPTGILSITAGTIICLYLSYIRIFDHQSIGKRPLLLLGIFLIIAGIQIISTGIVAEIITYYYQRNNANRHEN